MIKTETLTMDRFIHLLTGTFASDNTQTIKQIEQELSYNFFQNPHFPSIVYQCLTQQTQKSILQAASNFLEKILKECMISTKLTEKRRKDWVKWAIKALETDCVGTQRVEIARVYIMLEHRFATSPTTQQQTFRKVVRYIDYFLKKYRIQIAVILYREASEVKIKQCLKVDFYKIMIPSLLKLCHQMLKNMHTNQVNQPYFRVCWQILGEMLVVAEFLEFSPVIQKTMEQKQLLEIFQLIMFGEVKTVTEEDYILCVRVIMHYIKSMSQMHIMDERPQFPQFFSMIASKIWERFEHCDKTLVGTELLLLTSIIDANIKDISGYSVSQQFVDDVIFTGLMHGFYKEYGEEVKAVGESSDAAVAIQEGLLDACYEREHPTYLVGFLKLVLSLANAHYYLGRGIIMMLKQLLKQQPTDRGLLLTIMMLPLTMTDKQFLSQLQNYLLQHCQWALTSAPPLISFLFITLYHVYLQQLFFQEGSMHNFPDCILCHAFNSSPLQQFSISLMKDYYQQGYEYRVEQERIGKIIHSIQPSIIGLVTVLMEKYQQQIKNEIMQQLIEKVFDQKVVGSVEGEVRHELLSLGEQIVKGKHDKQLTTKIIVSLDKVFESNDYACYDESMVKIYREAYAQMPEHPAIKQRVMWMLKSGINSEHFPQLHPKYQSYLFAFYPLVQGQLLVRLKELIIQFLASCNQNIFPVALQMKMLLLLHWIIHHHHSILTPQDVHNIIQLCAMHQYLHVKRYGSQCYLVDGKYNMLIILLICLPIPITVNPKLLKQVLYDFDQYSMEYDVPQLIHVLGAHLMEIFNGVKHVNLEIDRVWSHCYLLLIYRGLQRLLTRQCRNVTKMYLEDDEGQLYIHHKQMNIVLADMKVIPNINPFQIFSDLYRTIRKSPKLNKWLDSILSKEYKAGEKERMKYLLNFQPVSHEGQLEYRRVLTIKRRIQ